MINNYNLLCVSFDGCKQIENVGGSIIDCWEHANNMGSKWYFYPFYFVISEKTVIDAPDELNHFFGKRIKTLLNRFKDGFNETENIELDPFEFSLYL